MTLWLDGFDRALIGFRLMTVSRTWWHGCWAPLLWLSLTGCYEATMVSSPEAASVPEAALPVAQSAVGQTSVDSQTLSILPLGDSITVGLDFWGSTPGGYRAELQRRLRRADIAFDFVGTQQSNPDAAQRFDPDHEGHGGLRIDELGSLVAGQSLQVAPDVVLLHAGTNDVAQAYQVGEAPDRLISLVRTLRAAAPRAWILVGRLLGSSYWAAQNTMDLFNEALALAIAQLREQDPRVLLVDTGLQPSDLVDYFHPGNAGYQRMAEGWFEALPRTTTTVGPARRGHGRSRSD